MLWSACASASSDDCLQGRWDGRLGGTRVTLEFDHLGEDMALLGRYYYSSRLQDLFLASSASDPMQWTETDSGGHTTGYLSVSCDSDRLDGTWASPDRTRKLSLNAERIKAYDRWRLDHATTRVVPKSDNHGHRYQQVVAPDIPDVETLRLISSAKGAGRINEALGQEFKSDLAAALECRLQEMLRHRLGDFYHHKSVTVEDWLPKAVVIRNEITGYCGGVREYYQTNYNTYRLSDGEWVLVGEWLAPEYAEAIAPSSLLGQALLQQYRVSSAGEDEGCFDALEFSPNSLSLASDGIRFWHEFDYSHRGCWGEVVVKKEVVQRFLSESGRRAYDELVGSQ